MDIFGFQYRNPKTGVSQLVPVEDYFTELKKEGAVKSYQLTKNIGNFQALFEASDSSARDRILLTLWDQYDGHALARTGGGGSSW